MSGQRVIRLSLAVLGALGSFALSWPYWRDFGYWAESRQMWLIYFVVGFLLAVFDFAIFLRSLSTLFEHDALSRESDGNAQPSSSIDERARS
jgi:hypothetical protein